MIPLEYMVSLSIHQLLYEGIKTMTDAELIRVGLGNLDRGREDRSRSSLPLRTASAPPRRRRSWSWPRSGSPLRRLAWASGGLAASRLKTVYALLRLRDPRGADGGGRLSAADRPDGDGDVPALRAPATGPIPRARTRSSRRCRTSWTARRAWTGELAQGLAFGSPRRADQGPRGEDGALPRPARGGGRRRAPQDRHRGDPRPGLRDAAPHPTGSASIQPAPAAEEGRRGSAARARASQAGPSAGRRPPGDSTGRPERGSGPGPGP